MQFNLADLFESLADAFPDRLAVVSGDMQITYGQLDERATRLANHWASQGVKAGQHLGLYLYNGHQYLECMLAAWKLRAVTINCNYRYVAEELRYVFDNADLVGCIYEPELEAEVKAAWLPHFAVMAAASAPLGSPPPAGFMQFQKKVWFQICAALL